jgi:hypothetical protein
MIFYNKEWIWIRYQGDQGRIIWIAATKPDNPRAFKGQAAHRGDQIVSFHRRRCRTVLGTIAQGETILHRWCWSEGPQRRRREQRSTVAGDRVATLDESARSGFFARVGLGINRPRLELDYGRGILIKAFCWFRLWTRGYQTNKEFIVMILQKGYLGEA